MMPIHENDFDAIGRLFDSLEQRLNGQLIELQNQTYEIGRARGRQEAQIEASTTPATEPRVLHFGQGNNIQVSSHYLLHGDEEVAALSIHHGDALAVTLTFPTDSQKSAVLRGLVAADAGVYEESLRQQVAQLDRLASETAALNEVQGKRIRELEEALQDRMTVGGDDDMVLVPRGVLASACHAISNRCDAPNTLASLRHYAHAPAAAQGGAA